MAMPPDKRHRCARWNGFFRFWNQAKQHGFATLPAGKDPDDVLLQAGSEGLKNIVATARSLVDTMWDRPVRQHDVRQPEQRAQFWQSDPVADPQYRQ
jgi:DNA primase